MKTLELLLSGLSITEDDYIYKGTFILSHQDQSLNMDLGDIQQDEKITELKRIFNLEESSEEIKETLMNMIMEKAAISSRFVEGKAYEEKSKGEKTEQAANSLDRA